MNQTQNNSYYQEGVPFVIECQFTEWTPETEFMLMRIYMKNLELLPGLKINKLYKQTMDIDSTLCTEIQDDIKSLKEDFESKLNTLFDKYNIKETKKEFKKYDDMKTREVKDYPSYLDYPLKSSSNIKETKKEFKKYDDMKTREVKDYPSYLDYPLKSSSNIKLQERNFGYHEVGTEDLSKMPNMGC